MILLGIGILGKHIVCVAVLGNTIKTAYNASGLLLILFSAILFTLPIPLFADYSGLILN